MANRLQVPISFLIIVAAVFYYFFGTMPRESSTSGNQENVFSTALAFEHVKAIGQQPHYVGTLEHEKVKNYIVSELEALGLEVQIQEGYSLSKEGVLTRPKNIISKIEGTGMGKALLLLTHYDSAVHSSFGASDAGSGVAVILEGLRAFLASGRTPPDNDIIVVFTDAEELGLNGAQLFVEEHPWARDVGLALNFESRGSGGSSFMLLETSHGNKKLIEHFINADPKYPVTNSLAYSVYKMLPNDTDLTVLREEGGINGFNFAFIDDHFDYHTANDIPKNLDMATLAHQGTYLMPLLEYFSQLSLENLNASEDLIYFNVPIFNMISYPFSWIWPMLIIAIIIFLGLLIYGISQADLKPRNIFYGLFPLLISLIASGGLAFLFWKLCLIIYPEYLEMEHGFTYNGYFYIAAVIFLSIGICFYTYHYLRRAKSSGEFLVAPLCLWLIICALAAKYLEGAAYFVVPAFFGFLQLFVLIRQKRPNLLLLSFLSLPSIFILLPFILSFPVALGLKILFVAAILAVFLWTLLWPVFRFYGNLRTLGLLSLFVFLLSIILAHIHSGFSVERPKPNSLVYLVDVDERKASWNTYDQMEDGWTEGYFSKTSVASEMEENFSSKYNSGFTKSTKAPMLEVRGPHIMKEQFSDSLGNQWHDLRIIPQRDINRIEIYTEEPYNFQEFEVNGLKAEPLSDNGDSFHIFKQRWSNRLLTYYAVDRDTLHLKFRVGRKDLPVFTIYEASHDLLTNTQLRVPPRPAGMIPRPFVLNDAIIVKKTVMIE